MVTFWINVATINLLLEPFRRTFRSEQPGDGPIEEEMGRMVGDNHRIAETRRFIPKSWSYDRKSKTQHPNVALRLIRPRMLIFFPFHGPLSSPSA